MLKHTCRLATHLKQNTRKTQSVKRMHPSVTKTTSNTLLYWYAYISPGPQGVVPVSQAFRL